MAKLVSKVQGSPYWHFKIPLLDKTGHIVRYERGSTKRVDKKSALLVAEARRKEILDRQQFGWKDDPPLLDFIDQCLKSTKASGKADFKNQVVFRNWLEPIVSKRRMMISQLDKPFMLSVRRRFAADGKSESYCNNLMTFLISVHNQANALGLDVGPAEDFKGLKPRVKRKTRYLMTGEEERLLAELDPKRSHAVAGYPKDYEERRKKFPRFQQMLQDQSDLAITLIDTGLRHTELTEGLWHSVDTVNFRSLNFYREKVGKEGHLVCTDRLSSILERRYATMGNSPYIFPSHIDPTKPRGYAPRGIRRAIQRADLNADHMVRRYGRFTAMHSFRHTFASRLVQAGMSLYAVANLLGHSDVTMTSRYAHLEPATDALRAADILNAAVPKSAHYRQSQHTEVSELL